MLILRREQPPRCNTQLYHIAKHLPCQDHTFHHHPLLRFLKLRHLQSGIRSCLPHPHPHPNLQNQNSNPRLQPRWTIYNQKYLRHSPITLRSPAAYRLQHHRLHLQQFRWRAEPWKPVELPLELLRRSSSQEEPPRRILLREEIRSSLLTAFWPIAHILTRGIRKESFRNS